MATTVAILFLLSGNSCTKTEIYSEDVSGILTCRYKLPDGRVFDCEIDQAQKLISNSKDSLLFGTSSELLSKVTPLFSTTIGATIYANGVEIKNGESTIDLTKPLKIETRYKNATREYNVTALVEKKDHSETSGAKINTDMTMTGLAPFNSYSAAWFKGKLYILGAYYPNATAATGTAYYELFTSDDGAKWTKVETNPKVVGGYGARLIVLNDKMYAAGGARLWGKDVNGTDPEFSVAWRMMSTTNGTDWTDCTPGQVNAPTGRVFPQMTVHNGKIVLRRGKMYGFGMWQNVTQSNTYQTTDGTNWTIVNANVATGTNRSDDAMFSYNGKLWIAGGYVNWMGEANLREDIWSSSDDGATWVQESFLTGTDLKRYGHNVASYGNKLYMVAGEKLVGTARIGTNTVLESTNGSTWAPVAANLQLPVAFTSRVYSSVFLGEDNKLWIIGGYAQSEGNYLVSGLGMKVRYDVWTKKIK